MPLVNTDLPIFMNKQWCTQPIGQQAQASQFFFFIFLFNKENRGGKLYIQKEMKSQ